MALVSSLTAGASHGGQGDTGSAALGQSRPRSPALCPRQHLLVGTPWWVLCPPPSSANTSQGQVLLRRGLRRVPPSSISSSSSLCPPAHPARPPEGQGLPMPGVAPGLVCFTLKASQQQPPDCTPSTTSTSHRLLPVPCTRSECPGVTLSHQQRDGRGFGREQARVLIVQLWGEKNQHNFLIRAVVGTKPIC